MTLLIGSLYCIALFGFIVFGLHRLLLLGTFYWYRRRPRVLARAPLPALLPRVCIQCPVFNEPLVVVELLESVTAIEWDAERLEVQILDDSTDETPQIIDAWLRENRERAMCCRHIRRSNRHGYKAGALAEGMRRSDAEFFAILDADFRPLPDFLWRMMPLFSGPRIAAVQARWEFTNRTRSLLTRLQAVFLDAHFLIEQGARNAAGLFINFNGTAGIWRRAALEDAGGWSADTVTEDLDLSYRAQMRGWQMIYDNDYTVPSELPESVAAFKSQQRRWTKGGIQVFRKTILGVMMSSMRPRVKLEAFYHLGIGFVHVFLVLFAVVLVPSLIIADALPNGPLTVMHPLVLVVGSGATIALYLSGQYFRQGRIREGLMFVVASPAVMAFGLAMSVTCLLAVLEGLVFDGGEFVRTPKGGSKIRTHGALRGSIARAGMAFVTAVEIALGALLAGASIYFVDESMPWIALTLAVKSCGFFTLGLSSLHDFGWRAFFAGLTAPREADLAR
jgi:cellulose synthase/poly-beta-1,6-N-acetylglucosamine synthase-like glycosyltransferase